MWVLLAMESPHPSSKNTHPAVRSVKRELVEANGQNTMHSVMNSMDGIRLVFVRAERSSLFIQTTTRQTNTHSPTSPTVVATSR